MWSHTEKTLQNRIAAHEKYGKYEINDWILHKLNLKVGQNVLDIGCGNGKQLIEYAKIIQPCGKATGIDISEDLLKEARIKSKSEQLTNVSLYKWSADDQLPYNENTFDVVSCCFSIYYYTDIKKTLNEIYRVMMPEGRFFVAAPTRNNISELNSLLGIKSSYVKRTECDIIPEICNTFPTTEIEIFHNPIEFPSVDTFMEYFTSTLTYKDISLDKEDMITSVVQNTIDKKGCFTMTKEVYCILAKC
jgi:ubiquinone/menaquinone biosynthesis C-methylase UbiE